MQKLGFYDFCYHQKQLYQITLGDHFCRGKNDVYPQTLKFSKSKYCNGNFINPKQNYYRLSNAVTPSKTNDYGLMNYLYLTHHLMPSTRVRAESGIALNVKYASTQPAYLLQWFARDTSMCTLCCT